MRTENQSMLHDEYFVLSRNCEALMVQHKATKKLAKQALDKGLLEAAYVYLSMAGDIWVKYCEVSDKLEE